MDTFNKLLAIVMIVTGGLIIIGVIKMLICDWLDDHWR